MRTIAKKIVLFLAGLFALGIVFATGIEVGHRRGYDSGWRDCKFDAKESCGIKADDVFWRWYYSGEPIIRKRRSFWFE